MSCTSQGPHRRRLAIVALLAVALLAASTQLAGSRADAAGPAYGGPQTQATGPAYFGPAPNPFPYCENPTYFDPFPENVTPIGSIDVTGSPNASVTTNEVTMDFTLTNNGTAFDPEGQYPGFFPFEGLGGPNDQPKGVEMASDDAAIITLSEPLFYTQWVFTDVDRANEGFFVTPTWTDPAASHAIAVFGGDTEFEFTGTVEDQAAFNDTNAVGEDSESINGRVQVDMIGAVTGITLERDTGNGQSGFAIGGGCSPIGVAKEITSGPSWNGSSFDVTYTMRVRNNLPSATTISADIAAALASAASGTTAGTVDGIEMTQVQLTDVLTDAAFGTIDVVSLTNTSGQVQVNDGFDGVLDTNIIAPDETIPAETEEEFVLVLRYTPEITGPLGGTCSAAYSLSNSAVASGVAAGVPVEDESDAGADPDPGVDNGDGGTDDATVVEFPCPPRPAGQVTMSKTVLPEGGDCSTAVEGEDELVVGVAGTAVTWCFTIINSGQVPLTDLSFDDPLLGIVDLDVLAVHGANAPSLAPGGSISFGEPGTIPEGTAVNTASVEGVPSTEDGTPTGADPVGDDDTAEVDATTAIAELTLVKTVVEGPGGTCPADFAAGTPGDGVALATRVGATVTYCLNVANTGAVALQNVSVTDAQAPAGFVGAVGDLAVGAEAVLSFDLVITMDTPVANTATATGQDPDGADVPPSEDTALIDPSEPVPDELSADLAVTKSVSNAGPAPVGTTLTYTIVVTNNGPDAAEDPTLTDDVPTGIEIVAAPTAEGWSCSLDATGFDCARAEPMPNGTSETLTYTARSTTAAAVGSALTNTVEVSSPTADPDLTNNEDTSTTTTRLTPTDLPVAPEYPGPFTPPSVPANPPAAPSPPLAITGTSAVLLTTLATLFLALGGVVAVFGRRESDHGWESSPS